MKRILLALILLSSLLTGSVYILPTAKANAIPVTCENGIQAEVSNNATADEIAVACGNQCSGSGSFLGFPTWYKYLDIGPEYITIEDKDGNPVLTVEDPCAIIGPTHTDGSMDMAKASTYVGIAVVEILLRIAVIAALGYVMYGGFRYITSQGESENTKSARQTMVNALIGLTISLIATALVAFLANQLTK